MGEKLTFHNLLFTKNYSIEIPIIQRDYVHGRNSATEIRVKFLTDLKGYLETDAPIELDFIYGSIVNKGDIKHFIPLDGQQRLTTLFLLHWFLAYRENKMADFRNLLLAGTKVKFSYETRASSREFCHALVANEIAPSSNDKMLSECIKDSAWFFSSWENDPTIESMLVVIDELNKTFHQTAGYYDKLTANAIPLISFQFIELKEFGLTDSLYIKMNSRGKELTEFENFKARFEQAILQINSEEALTIHNEFSEKIDSDWTDLFWYYRDPVTNLFDDQLMNFIRVLATNHYASGPFDSEKSDGNIRLLMDNKKKVSFLRYEQVNCFTKEAILDIIRILDIFKNGTDGAKVYLDDKTLLDERYLFQKATKNDLSYTEMVIFYSLYKYLIKNTYQKEELFDWVRVIQNLAVNTTYNGPDDFSRSIRSIDQLLSYSTSILTYLANDSKVDGFLEIQIVEEKIKALLVKKGKHWEEEIYKYERHEYFDGQIGFLVKFSGIEGYYKTHGKHLNWTEQEDLQFLDQFVSFGEKATNMFHKEGLDEYDDHLWRRAILTKGDYLLLTSNKRNKCFLVDDDRDTGWKRLLRDDTHQRDYVGAVLNDIRIDSVKEDLIRMIAKDDTLDWRRYFIKRPKLLEACGPKRLIRFNGEHEILLLTKTQMNGLHREYYTYALALKLDDMGNKIEYPGSYSQDDDRSINKINNKEVYINYENGAYKLWDSDETWISFSSESEIVHYLNENQYLV